MQYYFSFCKEIRAVANDMQNCVRLQYITGLQSTQLCAYVCVMPKRMDRKLNRCFLISPYLLQDQRTQRVMKRQSFWTCTHQ